MLIILMVILYLIIVWDMYSKGQVKKNNINNDDFVECSLNILWSNSFIRFLLPCLYMRIWGHFIFEAVNKQRILEINLLTKFIV